MQEDKKTKDFIEAAKKINRIRNEIGKSANCRAKNNRKRDEDFIKENTEKDWRNRPRGSYGPSKEDDRRKVKRWCYYTNRSSEILANPSEMTVFRFLKADKLRKFGKAIKFYTYSEYRNYLKNFSFEKWIDRPTQENQSRRKKT